jgi:thermitase
VTSLGLAALLQNLQNSDAHPIKVAVVDSGVNINHPDLAGKTLPGRNIIAANADVTDEGGHGTFVAGVIAQVAPEAKIIPVKVLNSNGYGTISDTAKGIRWAADNGAKIINVSLGTYYESAELNSAISYARDTKGALLVASVGNNNTSNLRYPGSYHKSFSVAAIDQTNRKTSFSNFGKERVRVVAPGVQIYSTYFKGGYAYGDGTSFSTPIVAGLSALVWAKKTDWKWDNVIGEIESKSVMLDKCDPVYGANSLGKGVIDAYSSLGGQPLKDRQFDRFTCQNGNPVS